MSRISFSQLVILLLIGILLFGDFSKICNKIISVVCQVSNSNTFFKKKQN